MPSRAEDFGQRASALEQAQGETTETLRWAVTKLARVQAVQDEHTVRLERLESKMDEHTVRLERLESKMDEHTLRLERLESKTDALPRAIAEMIDASEKRLMAVIAGRA
jgi:chromosome segregation ATPase